MTFVHYRVLLKLLSPLHVGKKKYSNLMTTREYVPGRTLWGALAARITRDYFGGQVSMYKKIGDFLRQKFRLGYFWPSLDGESPYFPWEHEDFNFLLKSGYMGQPIDYDKKATQEGMLHEVEFISPRTNDGRPVYLIGDLWIEKGALKNSKEEKITIKINSVEVPLGEVFNKIQLGGEKGYGWGRVKLERLEIEGKRTIAGADYREERGEIILKFSKNSRIASHALAAGGESLNPVPEGSLTGSIEVLTGYGYYRKGKNGLEFGLAAPLICYSPDSTVNRDEELKLGEFGILEGP